MAAACDVIPTNTLTSFIDAYTYFASWGWHDPAGRAGPEGPEIEICRSFFVQHPGSDTEWVRQFSVMAPPPGDPNGTRRPALRRISVSNTAITLSVSNPDGATYLVQFSTDRNTWQTIATAQTGTTWTGSRPSGAVGFFQLAMP
jgi:hypothetical protein